MRHRATKTTSRVSFPRPSAYDRGIQRIWSFTFRAVARDIPFSFQEGHPKMEISPPSTAHAPTFDDTGKLSLDHVYNRPDPRDYFSTLSQLDYRVPELAKPFFVRLIEARREARGEAEAKIVDVGCSYGVNAALLKHDMSLDDLYRLYSEEAPDDQRALIARDRALFSGSDDALSVVGIDAAENAIAYAVDAGILDAGVSTNLEREQPTDADLRAIEDSDMIISTGCVGYVTKTSLEHLVDSGRDKGAWMANFVLRMFDYEPVEEMLAGHGYVTERLDGAFFPQRRFVSAAEQEHVLDNLRARGLSPEEAERDGWYLAELHVSRPENQASAALEEILSP
jgi:SAM-dependent methyltransferase